jgi:hypothetical protein
MEALFSTSVFLVTSMGILAMHMPGASSFKLYDCDVILWVNKMPLPKIMTKIYLVLEIYLLKE